ncbi:MAG: ABC transporter ATP-binding protein [Clostridiales bacterium]|nr:ABC transporter ATP-binding protein [Clostridiales bacterium]MDD6765264.1 ABC transporter ATP-binding protein [Bacillota bacterium]
MIELKNVSKKYKDKTALSDCSITIPKGQIIGLFGANGAGKTTVMKCILGYLKYDGEITLDGEKIDEKNITRLSFATGDHSFFPSITANDHKIFYQMQFPEFNEKRYEALMKFFELPVKKKISEFSLGQQNQFEVVLAMSQGAEYIIMDEPFAGNDVFNREDFYEVLTGIVTKDETIIISTHLIEEIADYIDRAILIRSGRIIDDLSVTEIEESGRTLIEIVKERYDYRADRISRAIGEVK